MKTAQLTDGYAHKIKEHKKKLLERFASEFYGGDPAEETKKQGVNALLELMQTDPTVRDMVLNALDAQKDIVSEN